MAGDQRGLGSRSTGGVTARYAVYYVPAPESVLLHVGQRWLGRDVYSGDPVRRRMTLGLPLDQVTELTRSAARYGLHATLKAPFELAPDTSEDLLLSSARQLGSSLVPISAQLSVGAIGEFLALLLTENEQQVNELHRACLEYFEPQRAPLSEYDRTRRLQAPLSPEQLKALDQFGYPYILENFRFHITLTQRIKDAERRASVQQLLTDIFDRAWTEPHVIDAISILRQDDRQQPFKVIERVLLRGKST